MNERLPYVQEAMMSEIKEIRMPGGEWRALDTMSESELARLCRELESELETGIAVLAALADYGRRRWGSRDETTYTKATVRRSIIDRLADDGVSG